MSVKAFHTVLVLGLAVLGCDGKTPSELAGRVPAPGPAFVEPAPSRNATTEAIAIMNLDASIRAHRRQLERGLDMVTASALVEALMLRADFYGSFDDWDEALRVSKTILERRSADPAALLLRARVLSTLHEFSDALGLIDDARTLIPSEAPTRAIELEAWARHLESSARLALGAPIEEIVALRRSLSSSAPTYQNVTSLALALAQQGRFEEADTAFRDALEHYRDVSPFPFAWVAFQRGVMWSEQAGRPDLGRSLYQEALSYVPGYVLGNVHLAELDAWDGETRAAIERLLPLVEKTQDPEPLAVLASIEPSPQVARHYAATAKAAYERLIARFPEAFAHHASTPAAK